MIYPTISKIFFMDPNLLDKLDTPRAALRILVVLSEKPQGATINNFYETMKALGIGRAAIDTSRAALLEAGLTAEYHPDDEKRYVKVIDLTPLGVSVAIKLKAIAEMMRRSKEPVLPS
jgi:hypothetical protein